MVLTSFSLTVRTLRVSQLFFSFLLFVALMSSNAAAELAKGQKDSMEEKKSVASIPYNYVSILQLQERWLKEKERKQKQKDSVERGVRQQVENGQRRREEDVMTIVESMEARVNPEKKSIGGGSRMHCAVNRCNKEPKCVKKEELEVSAIVRRKDEDGGELRGNKKNNPGKVDTRRGFMSKRDNAAKEETKFQVRWIKKRVEEEAETKEVKGPARLANGQGYYRNQRHEWSSTGVIRATTRTMVWVRKGNKDGAAGENGV